MIGGFQCAQAEHTPEVWKTHPDVRTGDEKEDVSGEPGRMVTLRQVPKPIKLLEGIGNGGNGALKQST